jgi:hypothetical protein
MASFGKRNIRYPAVDKRDSRSASFSACAAWTAPSSSMPRRHAGQQKSRTKSPTGCWRRNFRPSRRRLRRASQRMRSARVWWTRRSRAAGTFWRCLELSADITAVSHDTDIELNVRKLNSTQSKCRRGETRGQRGKKPLSHCDGRGVGVRESGEAEGRAIRGRGEGFLRSWAQDLSRNLEPPRQPALEHDHDQEERSPNEVLPEGIEFEGALATLEIQRNKDQSQ